MTIDIETLTLERLEEMTEATAKTEAQESFKQALKAVVNTEIFGNSFSLSTLGTIGYLYNSKKISEKQAREACKLFAQNPEISAKYCQTLLSYAMKVVTGLQKSQKWKYEKEYLKSVEKFFTLKEIQTLCVEIAKLLNEKETAKAETEKALKEEAKRLGLTVDEE